MCRRQFANDACNRGTAGKLSKMNQKKIKIAHIKFFFFCCSLHTSFLFVLIFKCEEIKFSQKKSSLNWIIHTGNHVLLDACLEQKSTCQKNSVAGAQKKNFKSTYFSSHRYFLFSFLFSLLLMLADAFFILSKQVRNVYFHHSCKLLKTK